MFKKKISKVKREKLHMFKSSSKNKIQKIENSDKSKFNITNSIVVNPRLLDFPVMTEGIKNNVKQFDKKYHAALYNYQNNSTKANKDKWLFAKKELKFEKKIEKSEIKQITKLNKSSKGPISIKLDKNILIKLKSVNKYYPSKGFIQKALEDVNLDFKKGSFNVILGPSGSGKTTLLNMISGLDRSTSGQIIVNSNNISALSTKEITKFRRNNIGFVFQSYNLLPFLNVHDNIEIGRFLQKDESKKQNINEILDKMQMKDQRKKMTYELSGGQQQRVAIARALSKTPNLLICDEPTGALDQQTSKKVFELFQKINKKNQTTIIIVTHDKQVAKLAHQIIEIEDGKIKKVRQNKKPISALEMREI